MGNLFSLENFIWQAENVSINVQEKEIGANRIFYVSFSDGRPPLVLTRMNSFSGAMWTSVPPGRKEAEYIGNIIEVHFKKG